MNIRKKTRTHTRHVMHIIILEFRESWVHSRIPKRSFFPSLCLMRLYRCSCCLDSKKCFSSAARRNKYIRGMTREGRKKKRNPTSVLVRISAVRLALATTKQNIAIHIFKYDFFHIQKALKSFAALFRFTLPAHTCSGRDYKIVSFSLRLKEI